MAKVTFDRVHKAFGSFIALEELSLSIQSGEFVSLLGPSGCGKTTTLRMLAGLEQPTRGTISVGDRVVNDLAPGQRDIAMVFQSYALYPHMTVAQNIEYPLRKRGVARAQRREQVKRAAAQLQLEALLEVRPLAKCRVILPMVAEPGEIQAVRAIVEELAPMSSDLCS